MVSALGSAYNLTPLNKVTDDQYLIGYFSRPRIVRTGTFTTGDFTRQFQFNVDRGLLLLWFPGLLDRLKGVHGWRFSLVFTLQVNATPFHQGLVALSFQYDDFEPHTNWYSRARFPATCTNLPHVRFDFTENTMVQLKVPFLSKAEYMPLTTGPVPPYGNLSLNNILPVLTGDLPPTYHLMVHIEDVELIGVRPEAVTTVTYQAGLDPMRVEDKTSKPFSTALGLVAKAVRYAGPFIPYFSSIAGTTSWALDKAAGVATVFGYSKPPIREPPSKMILDTSALEMNIDKPVVAATVGPIVANRLKVAGFAGSDIDEMSLSYLFSRPSQIFAGLINANTNVGGNLYVCPCGPSFMWYKQLSGLGNNKAPTSGPSPSNSNAFLPSNLFWLSSYFQQWTGSFTFRFTFSKTKFHAGRLLVGFAPSNGSFYYDGSLTNQTIDIVDNVGGIPQPFGLSKTFDLRDNNVFEFHVPFTYPLPWLVWDEIYGSIVMKVLEPLISPSVVADRIHFLVEVYSNDFRVAIPNGVRYPVHNNALIIMQSGFAEEINVIPVDSEMTVGEDILSVKQLMMLPSTGPVDVVAGPLANAYSVPPWWFVQGIANNDPVIAGSQASFDFWSMSGTLAQGYAFVRGGNDYHMQILGTAPQGVYITAFSHPGIAGRAFLSTTVKYPSTTANVRYQKNGVGGFHIRFPAYQRTNRLSTWCLSGSNFGIQLSPTNSIDQYGNNEYFKVSIPMISVKDYTDTEPDVFYVLSKCASDDALCGHYMGPPPLYVPFQSNVAVATSDNSTAQYFNA